MSTRDVIFRNLEELRSRIAASAERVNRAPDAVRLVAVTKYAHLDWVRTLVELGHTDLGESRPQQLMQRAGEITSSVCWHLIGHLQRNKVELVLPVATWIHSVDSFRLLDKLQQESIKQNVQPRILLEVNVSGESAKDGFAPDELHSSCSRLLTYSALKIEGLMTMAPLADDPESARPVFRGLRALRDELTTLSDGQLNIPQLSMGMSHDFEVAIEEGATMIRIGSQLFEGMVNDR